MNVNGGRQRPEVPKKVGAVKNEGMWCVDGKRNEIVMDNFFKHDIHALADRSLKKLVNKYHGLGYAVFFVAVETLTREEGESISIQDLAEDTGISLYEDADEIEKILEYAIQIGLFSEDEGGVYSERVRSTCLRIKDKHDRDVENGKNGGRPKKETSKGEIENKKPQGLQQKTPNTKGVFNTKPQDDKGFLSENPLKPQEVKGLRGQNQDKDKDEDKDIDKDKYIYKASKPYINITGNDKSEGNDAGLLACSLPRIFRKDGSFFQTTEQYVTVKQKAFPSVDVMAEFWKMQAKTETTPTSRPFMQYLDGFVNSWLQKVANYNAEQERKASSSGKEPNLQSHICNDPRVFEEQGNPDGSFDL